jgi:DNA primase catalytic subunit
MSGKEERIRKITAWYYSNPKIQDSILKFAKDREVVPRYFEGFGKRPDSLVYPSDVLGLVRKGATSFHASEEIWNNVLGIDSDMSQKELNELRKDWDLVIDIDSPYLDCSKIAAKLIIEELERYGVRKCGLKFSGSKGFHILVSGKAFPDEYKDMRKVESFPEWPRAICGFLMERIRGKYNEIVGKMEINFDAVKRRINLSKEELIDTKFDGGEKALKGKMITFKCNKCGNVIQRPNPKLTKRKLRCIEADCGGVYEIANEEEYFYSEKGLSSFDRRYESDKKIVYSSVVKKEEGFSMGVKEEVEASKLGNLDLVLVAPRHLFRMPYSLHEKTSLSSVVLEKNEIENFDPARDADAMKVEVREFFPVNEKGEGAELLIAALDWDKVKRGKDAEMDRKKYKEYDEIDLKGVDERFFPKPIKKLLKGLEDGRKRGLFVLLTFLRCLGFSAEYIHENVKKWNEKNGKPLRDGYVKSQIDWHLKQRRKILPPNYSNGSFYKDLGILDEVPKVKNPLVEVLRKVRRRE